MTSQHLTEPTIKATDGVLLHDHLVDTWAELIVEFLVVENRKKK